MKTMSVRRKLMYSVLISIGIICVVLFYISIIITTVVNSISDSYKTNTTLNTYNITLTQTENALENYMQFKTFNGIDNYYNYSNKFDNLSEDFCKEPNSNLVANFEYKIVKLTNTFLLFSDAAVAARRANDMNEANKNYQKALTCYDFLKNAITELNTLYFQRNIERYNAATHTINSTSRNCFISVILIIILNLFLVFILITNITKPLVEISNVAHRLAKRDFDVPLFTINSNDEIGNICKAFNRMIISIKEYIDTIWEKAIQENELKEKEIEMKALYNDAQLRALQSQINPHFLFNTLNTGAQLAMMEEADRTSTFLEQVADFFRYNIQTPEQDTTLKDEIILVDTFMYIMKVRFGNKFEYTKKINTEDLSLKLPRMILQPLIEDCIKHGLKDISKGGKIILQVEVINDNISNKSYTEIKISDNGIGFQKEIKENILTKKNLSSKNGIGLSNVISRLELYFNSNNIFDIQENDSSSGTVFVLRIPHV